MTPDIPANYTRALAEHQDEYQTLHIVDRETEDGQNVMWSMWQPSPEELDQLNAGGHVLLGILGTKHPPVFVTAQPPGAGQTDGGEG